MDPPSDPHRPPAPQDHAVLLFLLGALLFASPLTFWWAGPVAGGWLWPYLLWAGLIGLIAYFERRPPSRPGR